MFKSRNQPTCSIIFAIFMFFFANLREKNLKLVFYFFIARFAILLLTNIDIDVDEWIYH